MQPYSYESNHFSEILAYAVIIVTNQTAKKHGTTTENTSRVTNKGIIMCCKSSTFNLLTVVGLLVEPITSVAKPKGYLEAYLSIIQPHITVTFSN